MIVVIRKALSNPLCLKNKLAYTLRKASPVSCWAQMGRVEPSVRRRSGPLKQSRYERRTPLRVFGSIS